MALDLEAKKAVAEPIKIIKFKQFFDIELKINLSVCRFKCF